MHKPKLTHEIKLAAMAAKFYDGLTWNPKAGDYYTTSRNDLELYQVVDVTDTEVITKYVNPSSDNTSAWQKDRFTTEDFGPRRVWIPDYLVIQLTGGVEFEL